MNDKLPICNPDNWDVKDMPVITINSNGFGFAQDVNDTLVNCLSYTQLKAVLGAYETGKYESLTPEGENIVLETLRETRSHASYDYETAVQRAMRCVNLSDKAAFEIGADSYLRLIHKLDGAIAIMEKRNG